MSLVRCKGNIEVFSFGQMFGPHWWIYHHYDGKTTCHVRTEWGAQPSEMGAGVFFNCTGNSTQHTSMGSLRYHPGHFLMNLVGQWQNQWQCSSGFFCQFWQEEVTIETYLLPPNRRATRGEQPYALLWLIYLCCVFIFVRMKWHLNSSSKWDPKQWGQWRQTRFGLLIWLSLWGEMDGPFLMRVLVSAGLFLQEKIPLGMTGISFLANLEVLFLTTQILFCIHELCNYKD